MGYIDLPDSMFANANPAPAAPPPVDPMVVREQQIADNTRAEQSLNQFLAAKQNLLFEAPDAFYRQQGEDAIHAALVTTQKLDELRTDLLDRLGNDAQQDRLNQALDAQMELTRGDMSRHVAEQSLAWQRKTAQDRIALLTKEAAYHDNDDDRIDVIGAAAATAARAHARVGDAPPNQEAEDAAAALARSGVLSAAIQAHLDRGDAPAAVAQLGRLEDQLDPAHAQQFQDQINAAQIIAGTSPDKPSPAEALVLSRPDATASGFVPVSNRPDEPASPLAAPQDGIEVAQALPGTKPRRPQPRKREIPPEQIAYPTDAQQKEIASHLHPDVASEAADRRKAAWDEMLKQLPKKGPGIKVPLSEDWRADLDKIDPSYAKLTEDAAKTYDVPPELLARLFHTESTYDRHADNGVRKGIPQMGVDETESSWRESHHVPERVRGGSNKRRSGLSSQAIWDFPQLAPSGGRLPQWPKVHRGLGSRGWPRLPQQGRDQKTICRLWRRPSRADDTEGHSR